MVCIFKGDILALSAISNRDKHLLNNALSYKSNLHKQMVIPTWHVSVVWIFQGKSDCRTGR